VSRFIKEEGLRENIKVILKKNYKPIRDAYKYTVGQDIFGEVMSIGLISFTNVM